MDIKLKLEFLRKRLKRPIVLVGLMGAGKTSVGEALAQSLHLNFIDSDDVVTRSAGCSIADIFKHEGEDSFRELERQAILNLSEGGDVKVIGTGGGAFMNVETRTAIQSKTLSVFLNAALDVLVKRVGGGEGRPLFDGKEPEAVLEELMAQRYPIYSQAHLSVPTYDEPLEETLNRVQQALYSQLMVG